MIIGALGTTIKYLIRFIIILTLLVSLLIGGYTSFLHKEYSVFNNLDNSITKILEEKTSAKISIDSIKENWSLSGVYFTINKLSINYNENTITSDKVNIGFKPLPLLLKNELKVTNIHFDNSEITINNKDRLITKEEAKDRKSRKELLYWLNKLTETEIKINNLTLKVPEEKIDLENMSIVKSSNDMYFSANYDDNVLIDFHYVIDEKNGEAIFQTKIDSNRKNLKSMISYAGRQSLLDFIYFDDIYTVIGDLKSDIMFSYNYKTNNFSDYGIKIHLNGNKIVLKSYDQITLTNARGTLYYDNKGFYSDRIKGNLDKKSSILHIEQKNSNNITFNFETKANMEKLSEIANFPLTKILKGSDNFKGAYELNFDKADRLWVKSDFKNINYLSKTNFKDEEGFSLEGFFDYDKQKMNFDIKQGNHEIALNFINGDFHNFSLGVNKSLNKRNKSKGFFVEGFIKNVDLVTFLKDIKEISEKFDSDKKIEKGKKAETVISISLKDSIVESEIYNNIDFLYQNNVVSLTLNEEDATGYLYYDEIANEIEINLDKFKVKTKDAKTIIVEDLAPEVKTSNVDMEALLNKDANIKIEIKDLQFDEIKNSLSFVAKGHVKDKKLTLETLSLNDKAKTFSVEGQYSYDSIKDKSYLIKKSKETPLIQIFDIDRFQKEMKGESSGITAERIILDGEVSWNGFSLNRIGETLSGDFKLDVGSGHIPKNLQGVGILKTMNLFNFDSWLKMFSFNFEEIEEGLHFNSIKGQFKIQDNVIKISPRIVLDSDLLILELRGDMDYIDSKYKIKVDAVVPLLNKAPAIALFAGVAPEVVGVIWLIDKIAGDVISETFTRASFEVSGSFENPVFEKGVIEKYENEEKQ